MIIILKLYYKQINVYKKIITIIIINCALNVKNSRALNKLNIIQNMT